MCITFIVIVDCFLSNLTIKFVLYIKNHIYLIYLMTWFNKPSSSIIILWAKEVLKLIMRAIVIGVQNDRLFVLDIENRQRVVVITRRARRFRPGNFVRIEFDGIMTNSMPPQIYAQRISLISWNNIWCDFC